MSDPERVLEFWFGTLDAEGCADAAHSARWWKKDPAFDDEIRRLFLAEHQRLAGPAENAWLETPRGCLATIIVLDQFSRNMFRGDSGSFASDARALAATRHAIARGFDRRFAKDERVFSYMPLMHSEDLGAQEQCIAELGRMKDELPGPAQERFARNIDYAIKHRDIVARFGRFPHRNLVLGRESTPEEIAFLAQPGSSF